MTSLHLVTLPDDVRVIEMGNILRLGHDIMRPAVNDL
jgi:hypothetical protein